MINLQPIPIQTDRGEHIVYVSPVLLQSKEPPSIKSGRVGKLYVYRELRDKEYKENVDPADLLLVRNAEKLVIYYGQDFSKYYLGSFHVDFEKKLYWDWEADVNANQLAQYVRQLASYLFDPPVSLLPSVTVFTPTRPSDINLGVIRKQR